MSVSFDDLRQANLARLPHFKNRKGEAYHKDTKKDPGSEWIPAQWSNAVMGEVGEMAGLIKNMDRGECTLDEVRPALSREMADVAIYLDILAHRCGIDLGESVRTKFNEKSVTVGSPVRL